MTAAILGDGILKEEFLSHTFPGNVEMLWADSLRSLTIIEADLYFDLQFDAEAERVARLQKLLPRPVVVNSVTHTISEIGVPFIRINAWPTMLRRNMAEMVFPGGVVPEVVSRFFATANWNIQHGPDVPGMVTPRIVAMIVNEAFFALGEDISTRSEIDTAMKLGTNYPFGPFTWASLIGIQRVVALLKALARTDARYTIAPALLKELEG